MLIPRNETSVSWPRIAPVASAGISGLIIAEQQQPAEAAASVWKATAAAAADRRRRVGDGGKAVFKERKRRSLRGKVSRSQLFRRLLGGTTQSLQTPKDILILYEAKANAGGFLVFRTLNVRCASLI